MSYMTHWYEQAQRSSGWGKAAWYTWYGVAMLAIVAFWMVFGILKIWALLDPKGPSEIKLPQSPWQPRYDGSGNEEGSKHFDEFR
jgi:hypothetical protein